MTVKKRVSKMLSPRKSKGAAADEAAPLTVCVTGGAGFLGRHIVEGVHWCLSPVFLGHAKATRKSVNVHGSGDCRRAAKPSEHHYTTHVLASAAKR